MDYSELEQNQLKDKSQKEQQLQKAQSNTESSSQSMPSSASSLEDESSSASSLEEESSLYSSGSGQASGSSPPPAEIPCRRFPKDKSDLRRFVLTKNLSESTFFDDLISSLED